MKEEPRMCKRQSRTGSQAGRRLKLQKETVKGFIQRVVLIVGFVSAGEFICRAIYLLVIFTYNTINLYKVLQCEVRGLWMNFYQRSQCWSCLNSYWPKCPLHKIRLTLGGYCKVEFYVEKACISGTMSYSELREHEQTQVSSFYW